MLNNKKITEIEKEIPDITGLVTKTNFNTKVAEIENKIPDINEFDTKLNIISNLIYNKTTTGLNETK